MVSSLISLINSVESPGQTQEALLVGCSPESEQRTISSTYKSVANIQPDPESIAQDSHKLDESKRDVQEPGEPSTPIDKGIQSDLGGIAELEPESSTSPTLTTMVPKQPVYLNIRAPSSAVSLSLDDSSLTGIKSIHGLVTMSKKTCVYVLPA